jgi:hypothetical protein
LLVGVVPAIFRASSLPGPMPFIRALLSASRSAGCMSAAAGVALDRYHGFGCRRCTRPAAGSQEMAYQQIIRDWMRNANGTVRSTALGTRLQASPAPVTCLQAALEGSMV